MGDILDSRPRERCTSFDHLPTQAAKPHTRFNCARLAAAISGRYCLLRRRAGRDPGCEACAIGAQHEAAFGKELNAGQAARPSPIMHPILPPAPTPCGAGSNKTTVRNEEMHPDDTKLEITVQEAAEVSGLCRRTLFAYCRNGTLQARKAASGTSRGKDAWLINRESLHLLMQDPPRQGRGFKARVALRDKANMAEYKAAEKNKHDMEKATESIIKTPDIWQAQPIRVLSDDEGQVLLSRSENIDLFIEVTPGLKNLLAAIASGQVDAKALVARMQVGLLAR